MIPRMHYTSRVWMASVIASGNLHDTARLLRITIRALRPIAVRLLQRNLWGKMR